MADKVLDLGCGFFPREDSTHLVDNYNKRKGYINWDLERLPYPFKDNMFDKIYAESIYEHLGINLGNFIRECHRLLKQDGILILTMPNAWNIKKRIMFLLGKSLPSYHPDHVSYVRPSYAKEILIHAGFEVKGNSSNLLAPDINFRCRRRR